MSNRVVVLYGCLSDKADDEQSIPSQLAKVRERLAQEYPEGYEVAGEFTDDGKSGSKQNRGPGLQAAIDAATRAADEHGHAELWANTSARFGRGKGRKGKARSLLELFTQMNRAGVALRSVHDDDMLREELVGIASRMAAKYSEDLSESVRRAKRRQAEAGQRLGGPWPLGYHQPDGEPLPDPDHVSTVQRIFELAAEGMPDSPLARSVNAEGFRTRGGRPFNRRAIQAIVTNPTYAALVIHDGVEYEGDWQPLLDPDAWRAIQAARSKRDLGAERHVKGRPAHRHLLAKLARCGVCGSPMFAVTSSYTRKDGTRARQYVCRGYHTSDGTCSVKIDAEAVDTAVLEELPRLMPDFNRWIEQIEDRHAAERQRLLDQVESARRERDRLAGNLANARRRWAALRPEDQDVVLGALRLAEDDLSDAQTRLEATEDALASVPEDVGHDRLLDFATSLRAVIAGKLDGDRNVEQLNRALIELFSAFTIFREPPEDSLPEELEAALNTDAAYVCPNLRMEVVMRLLAEYEEGEPEPPPMEWIQALAAADGKSANTQESWHSNGELPLSRGSRSLGSRGQARAFHDPWVVARDESGPRYKTRGPLSSGLLCVCASLTQGRAGIKRASISASRGRSQKSLIIPRPVLVAASVLSL